MKNLKKAVTFITIMCLCLSMSSVVYADFFVEIDDGNIMQTISLETSADAINNKTHISIIEPTPICTKEDYVDYILNGEKDFTFSEVELNIEELLENSTNVEILSNGHAVGTFESTKIDTGTPFVKWYYTIDYEIEPYSNGYGWRFTDVQGHIFIQKGLLLYTWATSCIVTVEEATHTLDSNRTSVTIDIKLRFDVTTDAFYGVVTYHENHSHTTTIANLAPY